MRRKPPPTRSLLHRTRHHAPVCRDCKATARQRTQLQQHPRPRRRAELRAGVRGAGVRGRQAQQPVRRGGVGEARGRLQRGVGRRPAVRVRRHHRVQQSGRCRYRQRDHGPEGQAVRRVRHRARLRAARARRAQEVERERAPPQDRRADRLRPGLGLPPRRWRVARADARRGRRQTRSVEDRHEAEADRSGVRGAAFRVVRVQARQVERDRSREGHARCGRRRGADVARRVGRDRGEEGR